MNRSRKGLLAAALTLLAMIGVVVPASPAAAANDTCTPEGAVIHRYGFQVCVGWYGGGDGYWHVNDWFVLDSGAPCSPEYPVYTAQRFLDGTPTFYKYNGRTSMCPGHGSDFIPVNRTIRVGRRFMVEITLPVQAGNCTGYIMFHQTWVADFAGTLNGDGKTYC